MKALEIVANAVNALSILLAGRNSVHTWWTGIVGCVLFGVTFFFAKLYADVTLQVFFVVTSVIGWRAWLAGDAGAELPVARTRARELIFLVFAAVLVALGYGYLLRRFTDAWNPFVDSLVLTGSVFAQLLLMKRRFETWPGWIFVNTLSVPLFWTRGLYVTSALYAAFWLNAVISLAHWWRLMKREAEPA